MRIGWMPARYNRIGEGRRGNQECNRTKGSEGSEAMGGVLWTIEERHLGDVIQDDEHCAVCGRQETAGNWLEEAEVTNDGQDKDECVPVCATCLRRLGHAPSDEPPQRDDHGGDTAMDGTVSHSEEPGAQKQARGSRPPGKHATLTLLAGLTTCDGVVEVADRMCLTRHYTTDISLAVGLRLASLRGLSEIRLLSDVSQYTLLVMSRRMRCMRRAVIPNGTEWSQAVDMAVRRRPKAVPASNCLREVRDSLDALMVEHEGFVRCRSSAEYRERVHATVGGRRSRWGIVEIRDLFDGLDYEEMIGLADLLSRAGLMTRALSSDVMMMMAHKMGLLDDADGRNNAYRRLIKIRNGMLDACKRPPGGLQLHNVIGRYLRRWDKTVKGK